MMVLFRSTFITTTVTLLFALSFFSMTVVAGPQFGRPLLHVMDAVDGEKPVTYTDEGGSIQTVSAENAVVTPTISTAIAATSSTSTMINGAGSLQHTSGGKIVLGAAAVFVYFVLN